ncbi:hypothetical protein LTR05_002626 [Lithohypha guttulata]|uniref:Amino acid permease/ SLC12A domain-containing protein n=1 Tax=Lithohypha guttulata TaxID=1690604 RepID=A0AAN7Y7V3_9EURO|nr:hypothetical protein LTR05_002626 [Lithohypha guttulata]
MAPRKSPTSDIEAIFPSSSISTTAESLVAEANEKQAFAGATSQLSRWTRWGTTFDSFRRRQPQDAPDQLNHTLRTRHLYMIALGGCIGAGLFVGSGGALASGGPASLLLGFLTVGLLVFNVVQALGELAVLYPVSGGFYTYATRFIDPSVGFALGWNYCLQWAIVLPLELTVASEVIKFWNNDISVSVWITAFLAGIVVLNVFGVMGYGEFEFGSVTFKLIAIIIFLVTGLVNVLGAGPLDGVYHEYWGARLWNYPGAFHNGFKGFCSTFVTASFAYAGTELVGLAAAESRTPLKSLPRAVKQVTWRVVAFMVLPLIFVGLLVPYDDKRLFGSGEGFADTTASPFVIVAVNAGLKGFDSFICTVIVVSVISIGNSGVYAGSRTLTALAEQGYAPRFLTYIDRAGRPLASTVILICFGGVAYINTGEAGQTIFQWLMSLAGLAALFTWGSICVSHIRFRAAWRLQGRSMNEIPFQALFGTAGSWFSLILVVLALAAQLFVAIKPPGGGTANAEHFFKQSLTWPVVLLLWACGHFWNRKPWLKVARIDINSGQRQIDWVAHRVENQRQAEGSFVRRVVRFLF